MKKKGIAMLLAGILTLQSVLPVFAADVTAEDVNASQSTAEAAIEMQTKPLTVMSEEENTEVSEEQTPETVTVTSELQLETMQQSIQSSEDALSKTESELQSEIVLGEPEEEIILGEPVLETDALDAMQVSEIPIYTSDLIGIWEGIYGTPSYEIRLSVDSCEEDGNMSGTALINAGEKGTCSFYGSVDFQTGFVLLTGDEWFSNPDGLEFKTFTGTLNAASHIMNGVIGESTDAAFSVQKISENTMPAYMLAQSTTELPDYDIWMANTMLYGLEHDGNGLYQSFRNYTDPVYKELGGYLLEDKPLVYMSTAWSVFLNSEYRNQFANEQKYIYEVLLMAYLKYDSQSQSASSVLDNGLMKNAMKLYSMLANDIVENRSEYVNGMTVEDAIKFYDNTDILKKMNVAMSELQAGISSVKGLINTLSEYMTLQQAKEERVALLKTARDACASSNYRNDAFISAADELIKMVEESPLIYVQNKSADYLWGQMCDFAWDKLCEANPVLEAIDIGVKGMDMCFDNSTASSNNLKLAVLYTLDEYMKLGMINASTNYMTNATAANARTFLSCFQGYTTFQMYGNEFADTWLNDYLNSGVVSGFINMLFYRENLQTAKDLIELGKSQTANREKLMQLVDKYGQLYQKLYTTPDMEEELFDNSVPVTGVNFSQPSYYVRNKNDLFLVYANIQPADATNKNIIYSSSNPAILSVPENGGFATIHGAGTVTITAKTEEGGYTATQTVTIGDSVARTKVDSGKCGPNAYWHLFDDGVLYIFGSGEMYNYNRNDSHWPYTLKKAIVSDKITRIGNFAFWNYRDLLSIDLPSGLKDIGEGAFGYCSSLANIELPESLTSIGELAFLYSGLTSIKFPEGLTSIGLRAFLSCDNLTSIEFPKSLKNIGQEVFSCCGNLKSIKFQNGLTSIGVEAFSCCSSLTDIELPKGLTNIEAYAFWHCNGLKSIRFSEGLTSIGSAAFSGCSSLTSIDLPEGITTITGGTFYACSSLKSIGFPKGLTSIEGIAFMDCDSLTSIEFPEGLRSIEKEAFSDCDGLTSISFPKGLTSIAESVFSNCDNLTSIKFPEELTSIGKEAFSHCGALTNIKLPKKLTSIGEKAFLCCNGLTAIEIPESLMSIGYATFEWCGSLTGVELPESLTSIGESAFVGCADNFIIFGTKGSYAEKYAAEHGITFKERCKSHTYQTVITEQATCTRTGKSVEQCVNCGVTKPDSEKIIEKLPHQIKTVITKNATCSEEGESIDECTVCGERIAGSENTMPKLAHNYKVVALDATCTKEGTVYEQCTVCGEVKPGSEKTLPMTEHNYQRVTTEEPTCIKTGKSVEKCAECGEIKPNSEKVMPKTAHKFGAYKTTKEPTYTAEGLAERSCLVCGYQETKTLPKLTQETTVKFSQDSFSLQVGKSVSLKSYVTGMQEGDSISEWKSADADVASVDGNGQVTAREIGTAVITVSTKSGESAKITVRVYCGSAEEPDHTYEEVIEQAATCTEDGKAYQKCTVCGKKKDGSDRVIEAAGHQFGPYEVVTEATVFKSGLEESVCAVCKEKRTQILPRLEAAVRYSQEGLTIQLGETVSVKGYVTGIQNGDLITRWRSFAPNIAKVDADGNVTAMRAGLAYIAVGTRAGAVAKLLVTVEDHTVHTTGISNLHTGLKLEAGKNIALHPVIEPADSQDPVIYGSVAPNIATVSKDGVIKAIRVGLANIYVKSGTEYRKILVRVIAPSLTAITGVRKTGSLYEGVTYQLRPQRYPLGSAGVFYYKSSDPEIASVDKDGKITAKKKGFTTITVTARGVSTAMRLRVK